MLTTTFRIVVAMVALAVCAAPLACGGRFLGNGDRAPNVNATGGGSIDGDSPSALDAPNESTALDTRDDASFIGAPETSTRGRVPAQ